MQNCIHILLKILLTVEVFLVSYSFAFGYNKDPKVKLQKITSTSYRKSLIAMRTIQHIKAGHLLILMCNKNLRF